MFWKLALFQFSGLERST